MSRVQQPGMERPMSVRIDVVCDACSAAPRLGGTVTAHVRRATLRRRGWRCQVAGMEGNRRRQPGRMDFCGDCLREWDAEVAVRGPVMP